ncbi:14684_t:CDS:2 [Entrophospora sp. SA101]|nr:14684_t:CDS:2 [Entrophospora sp. SA101]
MSAAAEINGPKLSPLRDEFDCWQYDDAPNYTMKKLAQVIQSNVIRLTNNE